MQRSAVFDELPAKIATGLLAVVVGLCAAFVSTKLGDPTKKKLVFLGGAIFVTVVIAVTRRPKAVLLFLWAMMLPYNRMYYSFDRILGSQGAQGLYWIPADLILATLLGIWAIEAVVLKRVVKPQGIRLERYLIPFAVACLISSLFSERPIWGLFELVRIAKFALIIIFLRYHADRTIWWACIAGLGCSVGAQAGMSALQMATGSVSGLMGMFGGGGAAGGTLADVGTAAIGGWMRAVGTVGHPSNLACYFLLTIPLFVSLCLAFRRAELRILCGIIAIGGLGGLACTLSRWPGALCAVQLVTVGVLVAWLRLASPKRILGLVFVSAFCVAAVSLYYQDKIYDRLTRDLKASLDFRAKDTRIALDIFEAHPMFGVGLTNYAVDLIKYDPEIEWALENAEKARHELHIRTFVALHNFYLFMLAETGALGFAALLYFYWSVARVAVKSMLSCGGAWQAAVVGLLVGLLGVFAQGLVDFSFWVDPIFYTFALVCGLVATAPVLANGTAQGNQQHDLWQPNP